MLRVQSLVKGLSGLEFRVLKSSYNLNGRRMGL